MLKVDVISHSMCFCFKEKQNKKGSNSDIVRVREVSVDREREREREKSDVILYRKLTGLLLMWIKSNEVKLMQNCPNLYLSMHGITLSFQVFFFWGGRGVLHSENSRLVSCTS